MKIGKNGNNTNATVLSNIFGGIISLSVLLWLIFPRLSHMTAAYPGVDLINLL
jgi:hypothetical protein